MAARVARLADDAGDEPRRRHRDPAHSAIITAPGPDGHTHCAVFNADTGRGFTSPGPDGHVHRVHQLEIVMAAGHTHELSANRCPRRHHFETGRHVEPRR